MLAVIGTRPEAIKMAPIVHALEASDQLTVKVLATAQHRELLDQVLKVFDVAVDVDLDVMKHDQKLPELTASLLTQICSVIEKEQAAMVIAQGDTTTVLAAALASFYTRTPFAHVEAGLRSGNPDSPFPEEMNRRLADEIAILHFAPTEGSRANLEAEGYVNGTVHVTGNPVIDALYWVEQRVDRLPMETLGDGPLLLVTAHRRESFGGGLQRVVEALERLLERVSTLEILWPVHPNPNIRRTLGPLENHPRVHLTEPLDYPDFVAAMKYCDLIVTDSGGVQEEAPALGKPVLVIREETERPEAVATGQVRLIGTDVDRVFEEVLGVLENDELRAKMSRRFSPYGDGTCAEQIRRIIENSLGCG